MSDRTESTVDQQIQRLGAGSFQQLEREVARKRVQWFAESQDNADLCDRPSPREACDLFLSEYLGLSEADVQIVYETESEIEWLSRNSCPTLRACEELGLRTSQVCRAVYEKSTQALLSQLDPQLRFLRDYREIRPHSNHCRERIVRVDFEAMMALAVEEAKTSRQEGNKGYGAVVAVGNEVVGLAHDTAVTEEDPSLHAEVNAIRQAVRNLGDPNLSGAVLFSTCEPCPMCASLAVWTNLTTIVFGVSIEETAQLGKSRIRVGSQEIVERSPVMVEIVGGVLRDECRALYC